MKRDEALVQQALSPKFAEIKLKFEDLMAEFDEVAKQFSLYYEKEKVRRAYIDLSEQIDELLVDEVTIKLEQSKQKGLFC